MPRSTWRTLWLPVRATRGAWLASLGVFLYYGATMARDLSFYDSGELALVAMQGGLGHPLGQPLHTWLGWLATRLPGVPPLFALNLLSVFATALAVIPLVSLAEGMMEGWGPAEPRSATQMAAEAGSGEPPAPASAEVAASRVPPWLRASVLLPLGVSLVFVHPVIWENGTRVEVYALALVFGAWGLARVAATLAPRAEGGGGLFAAGVALGLAASANAYMAAVVALGLLPAMVAALARRRVGPMGLLKAGGGGLLGLLPFVHLPLVAGRTDVFVWGAPTGGEALSRYLRNADFDHNRGLGWSGLFDNLAEWGLWAGENGLVPLVILGLVAHGLRGKAAGLGRGFAGLAFVATVYVLCINAIFYPDVGDYLGYLSLPFAVLGAGAAALVARLVMEPGRGPWLGGLLGVALLGSLLVMSPAVWERSRHADRLARHLAQGAFDDAPPGAVVLVSSDHFVFPMLYLQEAEGRRPDLAILPLGLSGASWYWAHLYRRHPGLVPFALRGPGGPGDPAGRVARVRRFVAANHTRPVIYEDFATAVVYGEPGCPGRWLCGTETPASTRAPWGPISSPGPSSIKLTVSVTALPRRRRSWRAWP